MVTFVMLTKFQYKLKESFIHIQFASQGHTYPWVGNKGNFQNGGNGARFLKATIVRQKLIISC